MSLKQLITDALKNYRDANQNTRQQRRQTGQPLVERANALLTRLENEDTFDFEEFSALADQPGATRASEEAIRRLRDQLKPYFDYIKDRREQEEADRRLDKIPFHSEKEITGDEFAFLAYVKNWYIQRNYRTDAQIIEARDKAFRENRQKEIEAETKRLVDSSVTELAQANRVFWGSEAYNEFMRAVGVLKADLAPDSGRTPEEYKEHYENALRLGQAYLTYKAGDRRTINRNGRRRVALVNRIVDELTLLNEEIAGNEKMPEQCQKIEREKEERRREERRIAQEEQRRREREDQARRLQQEEERKREREQQQREAEQKRERDFAEAKKSLAYVLDLNNMFSDDYFAHYLKVSNYRGTYGIAQEERNLAVTEDEMKRIFTTATRNTDMKMEKARYTEENAAPFQSKDYYHRLENLYQILFRPDYFTNPNRPEFSLANGSDFEPMNGMHDPLNQTDAFQRFRKELEQDPAKCRDFMLHTEQYKDTFKKMVEEGSAQLEKQLTDGKEQIKQDVRYLLDYRNSLNAGYEEAMNRLERYVQTKEMLAEYKGGMPAKQADVLLELGMTVKQYEKAGRLIHERSLFQNYGPNVKETENRNAEQEVFKMTMRMLCDLYCNPSLNKAGSEEEIPQSLLQNGANYLFDPLLEEIPEAKKLLASCHDDAALRTAMEKTIKPRIDEMLNPENQEKERNQVKETIEYLKDYRNMLYPEYVTKGKALDSYLKKTSLYDAFHKEEHDRLGEIGLTDRQSRKIILLANTYGDKAREIMVHAPEQEDGLMQIMCLFTDVFCNPMFAEPGNEKSLPDSMKNAGAQMGYRMLYEGLKEYEDVRTGMDTGTQAGREALGKFLKEDPAKFKEMMSKVYLASAKAGRVNEYNQKKNAEEENNRREEEQQKATVRKKRRII